LRIDAGMWAVLAAAGVFAAVLVSPSVLSGDALFWHIAAGRWMIENQAVLRINLFSFTHAGDSWINQDWLSEFLLAGAYVGAGWSGVVSLTALAAGSSAGFLAFHLARGRRVAVAGLWFLLAVIAAAGSVKALPFVLALPCLVAWTGALAHAGDRPPLKFLVVMLVWANLSNSFVFGLGLAVLVGAEQVLFAKDRLAVARAWAVFVGFSFLFSLITPTGVFGLVAALRVLRPGPVVSVLPLLVGLPAIAMLISQRRMVLRAVFVGGFFAVALMSVSAALGFAVMVPLLAAGAAQDEKLQLKLRPVFALIGVIVVGAVVRIALPLDRGDDAVTPKTALAAVPPSLKRQPVLNERAFGGFLIFREIKPFIDGRPLYAPAFRRRTTEPGLVAETLARYHIRWTILKPGNPVIAQMDGMSGWHRLYADQWAVVHVKTATH
jgi:hypothetical protein